MAVVKSKAKKTRSVRGNESHGHGRIGELERPHTTPLCGVSDGTAASRSHRSCEYDPLPLDDVADACRPFVFSPQASTASTLVAAVTLVVSTTTAS